MDSAAGVVQVAAAHGPDRVKESAAIWARAKACRDQNPEPATIEETMPGIWRRLSIDGASLFLAQRNGHPVGFLLAAPRARTLEIFYLAVDPDAWGCGVGSRLLLSAEDHAREIGRETLELWVINDNERAIRVYERSGWLGTDEVKLDTSSGRLERRFLRNVRQVQHPAATPTEPRSTAAPPVELEPSGSPRTSSRDRHRRASAGGRNRGRSALN